jgi:hypothetical protein
MPGVPVTVIAVVPAATAAAEHDAGEKDQRDGGT